MDEKLKKLDEWYENGARKNPGKYHHSYIKVAANKRIITSKGKTIALGEYIFEKDKKVRTKNQLLQQLQEKYSERGAPLHHKFYAKTNSGANKFRKYVLYFGDGTSEYVEEYGNELLKLVLNWFVERCFAQPDAFTSFEEILDKDYEKPSQLLVLLREVGTRIERLPQIASFVDNSLAGIAPFHMDEDVKIEFERATAELQNFDRPSIICISGDRYAGRTTLVRTILQHLDIHFDKSEAQYFHIGKTDKFRAECLPIFALNCRQKSYKEIIHFVLDFYKVDPFSDHRRLNLSDQLSQVRKMAREHPALFVLVGLDVNTEDPAQNQIKNMGIQRLIRAIVQASNFNKVIITNTGKTFDQFERSHGIAVLEMVLPQRKLHQFSTFFRTEKEIESIVKEKTLALGKMSNVPIMGSILSLATSAIRISWALEEKKRSAKCEKVVLELTKHARTIDRAKRSLHGIRRYELETKMCSKLWRIIEPYIHRVHPHLFSMLRYISASDDGLNLSSVRKIYKEHFPEVSHKQIDVLVTKLNKLVEITRGRLVFRSQDNTVNWLEFSPQEKIETSDALTRFVVEPPSARGLMRLCRDSDMAEYRRCYRTIANLSRQRAELIKLQMRGVYGESKSDLGRDIMAFVSLLASLDVEEITSAYSDRAAKNITTSDSYIFGANSVESGSLSDMDRLRYAYTHIFRRDIDPDHRLTMRLDQDELRLSLLLQLFDGVGQRRRGSRVNLIKIGPNVPEHLSRTFDVKEIAEILTSLAVAAFYSDDVKRFYDVVNLTNNFESTLLESAEHKPKKNKSSAFSVPDYQAFILRSFKLQEMRLDALFIGYVDADKDPLDGWQEFEVLCRKLEKKYPAVNSDDAAQLDPALKLSFQRIRRRIVLHKYRLKNMTRAREFPVSKFLARFKVNTAKLYHDRADISLGLSGRPARHMIKSLLGEPAFDSGEVFGQKADAVSRLKMAEDLNSFNVSRLSEYTGGDRVGLLIDKALIASFKQEWQNALQYINQASDEIDHSMISYGLQADLIWHHAQILYAAAQNGFDKPTKLYSKSLDTIDELSHLTKNRFPYYENASLVLKTKIRQSLGAALSPDEIDVYDRARANLRRLGVSRLERFIIPLDSFVAESKQRALSP